jgi:translation initiation factor IF-2
VKLCPLFHYLITITIWVLHAPPTRPRVRPRSAPAAALLMPPPSRPCSHPHAPLPGPRWRHARPPACPCPAPRRRPLLGPDAAPRPRRGPCMAPARPCLAPRRRPMLGPGAASRSHPRAPPLGPGCGPLPGGAHAAPGAAPRSRPRAPPLGPGGGPLPGGAHPAPARLRGPSAARMALGAASRTPGTRTTFPCTQPHASLLIFSFN